MIIYHKVEDAKDFTFIIDQYMRERVGIWIWIWIFFFFLGGKYEVDYLM